MVTLANLLDWFDRLDRVYEENKEYLTNLDAAIGDADHGINMARGFAAVTGALGQNPPEDIGAVLKAVSMTLIRTVGGAAGPLYGTFFLRASAICSGKTGLSAADIVELFDAGVAGLVQRGKAEPEDKTMIDAWLPAVDELKKSLAENAPIGDMMRRAAEAAGQGAQATIPLVARKGRASYLGERSRGHQDPGATSTHLMLQAAAESWG